MFLHSEFNFTEFYDYNIKKPNDIINTPQTISTNLFEFLINVT